ncbi:MltA domain-containing protein [Phenylobacterium soli]|uniref:peptidoglycan lytic exotransglycosylase n=1 Tax=Phenylobacterium soli TaxID=2170551 RepID=A0A328AG86_9CAUL|nr:MltA domain-containing protein [Phenylobacterium soli]RAK53601.1 transglycosylase [Phenylobacterium soli]
MTRVTLRALGSAAFAALLLAACATAPPARPGGGPPSPFPPEPRPPEPVEKTLPVSALPGWAAEDHVAAYDAFRATCGAAKDAQMAAVCRGARAIGPLDRDHARRFFEANFEAERLTGEGVLTGYFAPEYAARKAPDAEFSAPLRRKPGDLKTVDAGLFDPAQAGHAGAAIDPPGGALQPYPDRTAIEAQPAADALAWMRPEDLFFLQVQGSGVLTFEDGRRMKALYAANNGRPFVAIANPMRQMGLLPADNTSGEAIRSWLAAHRGPEADAIMRLNPRYAFFSLAADDGKPPVGAANVPLPAGRSLAIDPTRHLMGELFWVDAEAPLLAGAFPAYRRMATALDTGGAIKGDIRADLYVGQGAAAGAEAGRIRHTLRLYKLAPK